MLHLLNRKGKPATFEHSKTRGLVGVLVAKFLWLFGVQPPPM